MHDNSLHPLERHVHRIVSLGRDCQSFLPRHVDDTIFDSSLDCHQKMYPSNPIPGPNNQAIHANNLFDIAYNTMDVTHCHQPQTTESSRDSQP